MGIGKLYDRVIEAGKTFFSFEKARKASSPSQKAGGLLAGSPSSWRPWSGDPYQQCVEYRNWVYTAVRFRGIKRQSPPIVVRYIAPGEKEKYYHERRKSFRHGSDLGFRRFVKSAKPAGGRVGTDLEYLPAEHEAMKLLHNPNDPQIGIDLWFMASMFEDLTGRAHIWKVRNGRGDVVELWILPTPWVDPRPGNNRLIDTYKVTMPNGGSEILDAADVITIGEPSPFGYLAWSSPLQAHGLNVDLFNATVTARFNGLVNGANVGTMIKVPSSMANNPDMMQRFEASLLSRVIGGINYNRPLIAEEGADLINLSPQMELAFSQSSTQVRADIFAAFDLDEQAMGYSKFTTKASAVVVDNQIHQKIVAPFQERRNAILTEKLLIPDFGVDLVAINEWHQEETDEEKDKRIRTMKDCGAITVNEVRQAYDYEPFDDPIYDEPIAMSGGGGLGAMNDEYSQDDPLANITANDRAKVIQSLYNPKTNGVH